MQCKLRVDKGFLHWLHNLQAGRTSGGGVVGGVFEEPEDGKKGE